MPDLVEELLVVEECAELLGGGTAGGCFEIGVVGPAGTTLTGDLSDLGSGRAAPCEPSIRDRDRAWSDE